MCSRFPALTETFIYREIAAVEEAGVGVVPMALFKGEVGALQPELAKLSRTFSVLASSPLQCIAGVVQMTTASPGRTLKALWILLRSCVGGRARFSYVGRCLATAFVAGGLHRMLRREGLTHVHAHFASYPALAAWFLHIVDRRITYSVTGHAHDLFEVDPMLRAKLCDAEAVFCISDYNRRWIRERLGVPDERLRVVRCGVDLAVFKPDELAREDASSRPLRIASVGSLQEYKGHDVLIRAVAELRERGVDVHCEILGGGPLEDVLLGLTHDLSVSDRVILLGGLARDDVISALGRADVFCLASRRVASGRMEGVPVAIMEASGMGLPVVSTNLSGVPEVVVDGETGFLVPPEDPVALADALEKLDGDDQLRVRMGLSGRSLMEDHFELFQNGRLLAQWFGRAASAREL